MSEKIVITAKGGGNEVGASCYDYEFDDELVRIDCGGRPSQFKSDIHPILIRNKKLASFLDEMLVKPEVNPLPNWETISELKHLAVTHAHYDHVAIIPYVVRKHRGIIIYMTPVTAKLCKLQWFSTPAIAERKGEIPLFNEEDAKFALSRIQEIHPSQRIKINDKLELGPIEAGHLLGAVSYIFYWKGEPIGFHTGDFTTHNNQRSVPDAPQVRFDHLRFLTSESTRITEKNPPRHVVEEEFKNTVRDAYNQDLKIRIFGFAIGRTQEVFALAKEACPDADIWIDGLARDVSAIYAEHLGGVFSGIGKHFVLDVPPHDTHRREIIESGKPNIVLSPSAMQFGGRSRKYAEYGCHRSDHLFVSPGYRDRRSPEYAFFAASDGDVFRFGPHTIPKRCKTAAFNLTSHCDGDDIIELCEQTNAERVFLVHGDDKKMDQFIEGHPDQGFVKLENNQPVVV